MKKIRALALILTSAFTLGSGLAFASSVATPSTNDAASVTTVSYYRHHRRERRWVRYRGRDGRWHHHYVYVYVNI